MNKILDKRFDLDQIMILVSHGRTIEILVWIYDRSFYSKTGDVIYPTYRDMIEKKPEYVEQIVNNIPGFFSAEEQRIVVHKLTMENIRITSPDGLAV